MMKTLITDDIIKLLEIKVDEILRHLNQYFNEVPHGILSARANKTASFEYEFTRSYGVPRLVINNIELGVFGYHLIEVAIIDPDGNLRTDVRSRRLAKKIKKALKLINKKAKTNKDLEIRSRIL